MSVTWPLISSIIGWTYIIAWSISFYPQVLLNYQRKSVTGLALDYPFLNILGFACYSTYSLVFLLSGTVQREYRHRNHDSDPLVRWNDAVFALHALVLSLLTLSQAYYWGYHKAKGQIVSLPAKLFFGGSLVTVAVLCVIAKVGSLGWIDVIYAMSYIKLLVSLGKCTPQLYLNYRRKSTVGWSITNILLDFFGGVLSLLQLLIDCAITNNWNAFRGNFLKTGLGFLAIFFDTLFIVQHYVLYKGRKPVQMNEETDPLLPAPSRSV